MPKPRTMSFETAETIALDALTFLAEDGARLGRFLSLTGLDPQHLREAAGSAHTLSAVLDHLLGDESLLLVFAASRGYQPTEIAPARELIGRAAGEGGRKA